jgi:ABC-type uncharacterized transport system substrate-binding protein
MKRREFIGLLGGAVAWPLGARAQQTGRVYRIVALATVPWTAVGGLVSALRDGLRERGYVEGQNITIDFHSPVGSFEESPDLAGALVHNKVDLILAWTTPSVITARRATSTIPIVMVGIADPVGLGIVASLARPRGNVTGISNLARDLSGKLVELLQEIVSSISRIGVLYNPNNQGVALQLQETRNAIVALKLGFMEVTARTPEEFENAFARLKADGVDAVVLLADSSLLEYAGMIGKLALQANLPTAFQRRENVQAGGLLSYGASLKDQFHQVAVYIDRILKGAVPADLPVDQPTKLELVINRKTATALGLAVPPSLLARADEVIE